MPNCIARLRAPRSLGVAATRAWTAASASAVVFCVASSAVWPGAAADARGGERTGIARAASAVEPPVAQPQLSTPNDAPGVRLAICGPPTLGATAHAGAGRFPPPPCTPLARWTLSHSTTTSLP